MRIIIKNCCLTITVSQARSLDIYLRKMIYNAKPVTLVVLNTTFFKEESPPFGCLYHLFKNGSITDLRLFKLFI